MMRAILAVALCAGFASTSEAGQGVAWDSWSGSDSEGTATHRLGATWQVERRDAAHWWGLNGEHARYRGSDWRVDETRLFVRGAGGGERWRWSGRLGSNGETWIGDATLYSTRAARSEFFIERDRLDTRNGALQGRYQTFAGAAQDWPVHPRVTLAGVAGLQDFTGGNRRTHLRGTASFTLSDELGIATQLRTRWFKDSAPERADYFAPGEYSEVLGTLVLTRRVQGLRARVVLGAGERQVRGGGREPARLAEGLLETPEWREGLRFRLRIGYSDAPQAAAVGPGYRYRYVGVDGSLPL